MVPLVDAEFNRRFPGRADRQAADPDGLRAAWAALERTWVTTLERVAAMPVDTVEVSVERTFLGGDGGSDASIVAARRLC